MIRTFLLVLPALVCGATHYKVPSYYGYFNLDFFDDLSDLVEIEMHEGVDEAPDAIYVGAGNQLFRAATHSRHFEVLVGGKSGPTQLPGGTRWATPPTPQSTPSRGWSTSAATWRTCRSRQPGSSWSRTSSPT